MARIFLQILLLSCLVVGIGRCSKSSGGGSSLPWNAYSYSFDGTGYVEFVPFRTLMDLAISSELTKMTVSFWIKFANLPGNSTRPVLGATTNDSWEDGFVFWTGQNLTDIGEGAGINKLRFGPNDWNSQEAGIPMTDFTTDTWYHVVGVYNENGQVSNAQNVQIYLNGTLKEQIGLASGFENFREPTAGTGKLQFGRSQDTNRLTGQLDEVAIWKDNLTAAEIVELYNSGTPFRPTTEQGDYTSSGDLMGYWDMGDGSTFPTVDDRSGNSQNGTATSLSSSAVVADSPGGSE
ncbi:MAG: LamG domain-containing protein [Bdellovibrionota bacterium]